MKRFIVFLMVCMLLLGVNQLALAEEKNVINILLLGTDRVGDQVTGEEEMSRSDAIYVLNIRNDTGEVKLLSIERDYLVTLPDNTENKLATATYFGGPQLSMNEVNELFNLDISMYAQVDMLRLIDAVDAIGGLDIDVFEEDLKEVNLLIDSILKHRDDLSHLTVGTNHMNGITIRAFVGARDTEIDTIESNKRRNERQQRAVKAVLKKLHEMSFDEALDLLDEVLPLVQTNITMGELVSLTQSVQLNNSEMFTYLRSPISPYSRKRAGLHQVIVVDDMEKEISLVHDFLLK